MLNIEYYKDKLKELGIINLEKLALVQGQPHICDRNIRCRECLFNQFSSLCSVSALNWLFTEYKEEKEEPEEPEEPKVDWSKVKVDTPILVRNDGNSSWTRGYFAGYVHETVYAWKYGKTSWTAGDASGWNCAKLAESEE